MPPGADRGSRGHAAPARPSSHYDPARQGVPDDMMCTINPLGRKRMTTVWVGTSGYNYPEWRGSFYPEKFPTSKMLAYYAERFDTVEVNYTFYRIPTPALLDGWARGTPETFNFTLKAPRRITHDSNLRRCEELTQNFCRTAQTLGSKLGVLLFQLPPTLKRDDAVLAEFLELLPDGTRAAFEFRHESWHDDATFELLRKRDIALCIADSEKMSTPVV